MKKIFFIYMFLSIPFLIKTNGIFLWEHCENGHRSCCLHLPSGDICNPDVACTRTLFIDLLGISDYIGRILGMEKASTFPFYEFLKQAQAYIKRGMSLSLSYRYDYYVSNLNFYHDLAAQGLNSSKGDKPKATTSTTATDKAKQDDATLKYLMKLGLAKQIRK